MKFRYRLLLLGLIIYSVILLVVEWQTSQLFIRNFFTDIEGPVPFYAINTTLSVFTLWSTALLFMISALCVDKEQRPTDYWFYLSQTILFSFLGFDDRFLIHEMLGKWLHHNDAYIMLGYGFIEIGLLLALGRLRHKPLSALYFLAAGAGFFAIMVVIDALFPSGLQLRLSLEELSKLWGGICLSLFAWELLWQEIQWLKSTAVQP